MRASDNAVQISCVEHIEYANSSKLNPKFSYWKMKIWGVNTYDRNLWNTFNY